MYDIAIDHKVNIGKIYLKKRCFLCVFVYIYYYIYLIRPSGWCGMHIMFYQLIKFAYEKFSIKPLKEYCPFVLITPNICQRKIMSGVF